MIKNQDGQLIIGGLYALQLVEQFGEPIFAYDAETIKVQYDKLRSALPASVDIFYSMKANPAAAIVSVLGKHVSGVEVSSLRELYTAEAAGVAASRLIFVGPSKSEEELIAAVSKQMRCIVVESKAELHAVEQIAGELSLRPDVALRINPAFESTGARLKMGGTARQFGVDEEQAEAILKGAGNFQHAKIAGIHVYVGTRILDPALVVRNTREILALAARLQGALGFSFRFIDFGGGLGVPYSSTEAEFCIEDFSSQMHDLIGAAEKIFPDAIFALESGRYLVADSGVYLTRVRYVKKSRGYKFALVSGGMNHHMATAAPGSLLKTHFAMEAVNRMDEPKTESFSICGPLCTPSDVLGKAVPLPDLQPGDLVGILRSGAYGPTASPTDFLSHGRPSEVLVHTGRAHLIRVPPPLEAILDYQLIPDLSVAHAEAIV